MPRRRQVETDCGKLGWSASRHAWWDRCDMSRNGNRAERRRQTASTADLTVALDHHRAGRLNRAEALYRKFLRKSPGHPDALHLLGVIAVLRGDAGRAIELIGQAL